MSNYRKHIDDFFREKLGKYRETPPPEAWDELDARLDGLTPPVPGVSYRWMWHFAIVSVIVLLGVSVGRKIMNNQDANNNLVADNTTTATSATTTSSPSASNPVTEQSGTESTPTVGTQPNKENGPAAEKNTANDNAPSAPNQTTNPTRITNNKQNNNHAAVTAYKNESKKTTTGKTTATSSNISDNTKYTSSETPDNYKGSRSNPAPEDETNDNTQNNNKALNASPDATLSVANKPAVPNGTDKNVPSNKPQTSTAGKAGSTRTPILFPRWEAGVKVGYEGGFNSGAAQKAVIAPYLQYNLSPKFAIMAQPAIKSSTVRNQDLGSPKSYYNMNPEDRKITAGPTRDSSVTIGATTETYYITKYNYSQVHDSIVKTSRIGGTTMQFELPVLLKYNLSKQFSVYGGVNMVYSQLMGIKENTYQSKGILRSFDTTVVTMNTPSAPSVGFTYTGSPYSSYTGPLVPAQTGSEFSVGYMVGFTYAYRTKWLFDALLQQSPANADVKGGYNINTPLSSTYFRLSVGYKLTK